MLNKIKFYIFPFLQTLTINEIIADQKQSSIRDRLQMYRTYDFRELKKENETIGKRLEKK